MHFPPDDHNKAIQLANACEFWGISDQLPPQEHVRKCRRCAPFWDAWRETQEMERYLAPHAY